MQIFDNVQNIFSNNPVVRYDFYTKGFKIFSLHEEVRVHI